VVGESASGWDVLRVREASAPRSFVGVARDHGRGRGGRNRGPDDAREVGQARVLPVEDRAQHAQDVTEARQDECREDSRAQRDPHGGVVSAGEAEIGTQLGDRRHGDEGPDEGPQGEDLEGDPEPPGVAAQGLLSSVRRGHAFLPLS
jgi:hypothetical protein